MRNGPRTCAATVDSMPAALSMRSATRAPALCTTPSIRSVAETMNWQASRTASRSAISATTASAPRDAEVASVRSRSRPTASTLAPASTRPRAVSAPIPEVVPVTT